MDYNLVERKLTINLKEEKFKSEMLLEHADVKSIRFDDYPNSIELPGALADFKYLDTRCSWTILLLQYPLSSYLSASGCPMPLKGVSTMFFNSFLILKWFLNYWFSSSICNPLMQYW